MLTGLGRLLNLLMRLSRLSMCKPITLTLLPASDPSLPLLALLRLGIQQNEPLVQDLKTVTHLLQIAIKFTQYCLHILIGQLNDIALKLWLAFSVCMDEQMAF